MDYDSAADTNDHIDKVGGRIAQFSAAMLARAMAHDASKLQDPEKSGYDVLSFKLQDVVYGSDEYMAAVVEAKPFIDHHYAANSHHPEHYSNGIAGMSLLDIVEMLCDWKAASERTEWAKQGSIAASLVFNANRFGIDPQLASILENTVKELDW